MERKQDDATLCQFRVHKDRVCGEIRDLRWGGGGRGREEGRGERIQRSWTYIADGNLSLAEFAARTSLIEVILGQTTPPPISPIPLLPTSGPDPLISVHPLPLSSVSSCTKPSVIPSATETVTVLRIRSAPCPGNSNHYDAPVNSNRRANTKAARTTPREISTPLTPLPLFFLPSSSSSGLYRIFFRPFCPVFHRGTD